METKINIGATQEGFASITSSTGKEIPLYVGTHSETRAYLNTTSKELIPYLIEKYNLTSEDLMGVSANKDKLHKVELTNLPKVKNKLTGEMEYQGLFYPDSTEEQLDKYTYSGTIELSKVDNGRSLYVGDTSLYGIDDIPIKIENGVFVSLFCSGSSVSVIGDLTNKFGGVINENNHKCKYHLVIPTECLAELPTKTTLNVNALLSSLLNRCSKL